MNSAHPNTRVILGPPGTGKTTRLMSILEQELASGVRPEHIGFVSFTKAAVTEARDRACAKFGLDPERFDGFRTIHSQAYQLIGTPKLLKPSHLRAFGEQYRYELSDETRTDDNACEPAPSGSRDDELRAALEWCRARRLPIEQGLRSYEGECSLAAVQLFANRYAAFRLDNEVIDFTDMLEICLRGSLAVPRAVLFIDEVQDLSPLQIALVQVWMAESTRVYIAGDDDQAIYAFSGAEPDWLIELAKIHPVDVLTQSYRVPAAAHALAQRVIGRNRKRVAKTYAPRSERGIVETLSRHEAIARIDSDRSTFVLCRNVSKLRGVAGELFRARVPFISERGGMNPLGRPTLIAAINTAQRLAAGQLVSNRALGELGEFVLAAVFGPRGTKATILARAKLDPDDVTDWPLTTLRAAIAEHGPVGILTQKVDADVRAYLQAMLDRHGKIPAPKVVLTTIHGSKGREADHVIVFSDHAFPVQRALQNDPEPENRAAYVAVTRTRDRLTIVRPETSNYYSYPVAA